MKSYTAASNHFFNGREIQAESVSPSKIKRSGSLGVEQSS